VVRSPKFGQNSSARKVCFFIFINSTLVFEKQTKKQKNKKTKKQINKKTKICRFSNG